MCIELERDNGEDEEICVVELLWSKLVRVTIDKDRRVRGGIDSIKG